MGKTKVGFYTKHHELRHFGSSMIWTNEKQAWLLLASIGMLLSAIFAAVMAAYVLLWNWVVIRNILLWTD